LTTAPEDCTRIVNISNATEKLFGFTDLEQALAANINDHYLDLKQRAHVVRQIKADGEITDYTIQIKTVSGKIREVTITAGAKKNRASPMNWAESLLFYKIRNIRKSSRHVFLRTEKKYDGIFLRMILTMGSSETNTKRYLNFFIKKQ